MASPLEAGPELGQALVDDSASEELAARLAAKKLEGLELSDEGAPPPGRRRRRRRRLPVKQLSCGTLLR